MKSAKPSGLLPDIAVDGVGFRFAHHQAEPCPSPKEVLARGNPFIGDHPVELGSGHAVAEIPPKIGGAFGLPQKVECLGALGAGQALCPGMVQERKCLLEPFDLGFHPVRREFTAGE